MFFLDSLDCLDSREVARNRRARKKFERTSEGGFGERREKGEMKRKGPRS